jgi:arabinogalactan oligomer/maltooligosaccharide transport system substrate-binding protein
MKVLVVRWFTLVFLVLVACSSPVAIEPAPSPTLPVVADGAPTGEPTASAPPPAQPTESPAPTVREATRVDEPAAPTEAEPTPAPPPPPTLSIYTDDTGRGLEFLQAVAQEFGASSGWSVTVTSKESNVLRLDFEMAALAGQTPDVLVTSNDAIAPLVTANLLLPVDGWFDPADFAQPIVAAANIAGQQWGIPVSVGNQLLLLYNKKLVAVPPTTSDDLLKIPKPEAAEATLITNQNDPRWLTPWLLGFGGRVLSDDLRPTLNTPEMVAAYSFLRQLRTDGVSPELDFVSGSELFKQGQAAMIIDGDWSIPWYLDAAANAPDALDMGVAPLPIISSTNRPAASYVGGRYVLVPSGISDGKHELVRAFATYLTSAEIQARAVGELRRLPARMDILQSEVVQNDTVLKPQADSLGRAIPFPIQTEFAAIWDTLGSRTGAVMVGEVPPQTAAEEIQADAEATLGQ